MVKSPATGCRVLSCALMRFLLANCWECPLCKKIPGKTDTNKSAPYTPRWWTSRPDCELSETFVIYVSDVYKQVITQTGFSAVRCWSLSILLVLLQARSDPELERWKPPLDSLGWSKTQSTVFPRHSLVCLWKTETNNHHLMPHQHTQRKYVVTCV